MKIYAIALLLCTMLFTGCDTLIVDDGPYYNRGYGYYGSDGRYYRSNHYYQEKHYHHHHSSKPKKVVVKEVNHYHPTRRDRVERRIERRVERREHRRDRRYERRDNVKKSLDSFVKEAKRSSSKDKKKRH